MNNVHVQYCYNVYNQHWYEVILKSLNLELILSKTSNPRWLQSNNQCRKCPLIKCWDIMLFCVCNGDKQQSYVDEKYNINVFVM